MFSVTWAPIFVGDTMLASRLHDSYGELSIFQACPGSFGSFCPPEFKHSLNGQRLCGIPGGSNGWSSLERWRERIPRVSFRVKRASLTCSWVMPTALSSYPGSHSLSPSVSFLSLPPLDPISSMPPCKPPLRSFSSWYPASSIKILARGTTTMGTRAAGGIPDACVRG